MKRINAVVLEGYGSEILFDQLRISSWMLGGAGPRTFPGITIGGQSLSDENPGSFAKKNPESTSGSYGEFRVVVQKKRITPGVEYIIEKVESFETSGFMRREASTLYLSLGLDEDQECFGTSLMGVPLLDAPDDANPQFYRVLILGPI